MEENKQEKPKEQTPDIEDVLKNFITRLDPTGLSNPKDAPIREQIPEISQEFAGIVFALNQIISSGILTQRQGINLIRQFYEYDTGKMLRVSTLESIVMHEKVKKYETSIMPNIMKRFEKNESLKKLEQTDHTEQNTDQNNEHTDHTDQNNEEIRLQD